MKTSNKVLLSAYIVAALVCLTGLIIARSNSNIIRNTEVKGSGEMVKKLLISNWNSEELILDDNYAYIMHLDDNDVSVESYENITAHITASDSVKLKFQRNGNMHIADNELVKVYIGCRDKRDLFFNIRHGARVSFQDTFNLRMLGLDLNHDVQTNWIGNAETVNINLDDDVSLNATGNFTFAVIEMDEQSKLQSKDLKIENLSLMMADNSHFINPSINRINGTLEDYSALDIYDKWSSGDIRQQDQAEVRINKRKNREDE